MNILLHLKAKTPIVLCMVLALAHTQALWSQHFEWAQPIGNLEEDLAAHIATDDQGNLFTAGEFRGAIDFDPGPQETIIQSYGNADLYIRKLDATGNLVWVKRIGSATNDDISTIALDKGGNIYVSGYITNPVDFDPGPDTALFSGKAFILKLDPDGNYFWVRMFVANSIGFSSLAFSESGALYAGGAFRDGADFDPGPGTFFMSAYAGMVKSDAFLLKLDAGGHFVWAKKWGQIETDAVNHVALDQSGAVLCTGTFQYEVDFDPGPGVTTLSTSWFNTFIQKLDTSGNFIWAKAMTSANNAPTGLRIDQNDNILLGGVFSGTIDVDPGMEVHSLTTQNQYLDGYLLKLDSSGKVLWARQIGGPGNNTVDAFDIDALGDIYATGYFYLATDFDPGSGSMILTSPVDCAYILKTDFTGKTLWVKRLEGRSQGAKVIVAGNGNIYNTGTFKDNVDMNPGTNPVNFTSAGMNDGYVLKLSPQNQTVYSGVVFKDYNENGVRENGEIGLKNVVLEARALGKFATTDSQGTFRFFSDTPLDTIQTILPWVNWTTAPSFAVADSVQSPMIFAARGPQVQDVCIAAVEITPFRPGFETSVDIQVSNVGTVSLDHIPVRLKIVTQTMPEPLEYVSASPTPVSQTTDLLQWEIPHLDLYQKTSFRVVFRTPATVPIGEAVTISTSAILLDDAFPANNGSRIQATVIGAFDPNDKTVTPAVVPPSELDTTDLRYVIRFQNTGNFPATFVVIRDTLPPGLDPGTLKILSVSHPYHWRMYGNNILEFRFDPINLPDSTANEPESHGFVAFTIQAGNGLPLGTKILNRAGIYFDYNEPVITNTSVIQVGAVVKTIEPDTGEWLDFGLSPNPVPAYAQATVDLPGDTAPGTTLTVIDVLGKVVQHITVPTGQKQIYLNGLQSGSYFVQVRSGRLSGGQVLVVE